MDYRTNLDIDMGKIKETLRVYPIHKDMIDTTMEIIEENLFRINRETKIELSEKGKNNIFYQVKRIMKDNLSFAMGFCGIDQDDILRIVQDAISYLKEIEN